MQIIYFSSTNNIQKFVDKSNVEVFRGSSNLVTKEPFILLTYTTGFGEIPKEVETFLELNENFKNLKYVIGSGNKNWGHLYCRAAKDIASKYDAELLMTFELSGNIHDVNKFNEVVKEINERENIPRTK